METHSPCLPRWPAEPGPGREVGDSVVGGLQSPDKCVCVCVCCICTSALSSKPIRNGGWSLWGNTQNEDFQGHRYGHELVMRLG